MPNFRAVSAGVIPPPPTPKQAFVIATQNSFDYSSFVFVGITSIMAGGQMRTRNWGKASPGMGDTTGEGLSTRRMAITSLSLHCLQCSIRMNAITQWARAVSGNAPSIQPLASRSRRTITDTTALIFPSC